MRNPQQLLIIPITFWSGIEQGFFGADFTAVSSLSRASLGQASQQYSKIIELNKILFV